MVLWIPQIASWASPRYLAIVDALEADIAAGRVKPGARLLPQRDMAHRLGLSVGTISKAYAEAERRGLISGEVGRGTFVLRRGSVRQEAGSRPGRIVNLALNVPPSTGEDELIAAALAEIAADGSVAGLLGYLPHQGRRDHREAIAGFLASEGIDATPDHLFVTNGAQHAISIALNILARPGDTVLAECLTYSGMTALAAQTGCNLHGVEMDGEGILPDALDRAFAATGARVLYAMPTLQTPTASVVPQDRRVAIAEIISRHDACLIEDDAYGFLLPTPLRPISALIADRSFYVQSFAKCLAPGLRIGAMIVPPQFRDRAINAMRATGWLAVPIMAEVVKRLIYGGLAQQLKEKRRQAGIRYDIARRLLGARLQVNSPYPCFHVWLRMPLGRTVASLIAQAATFGIALAAPAVLEPTQAAEVGLRLCLGGADTEAELERVLGHLRDILEKNEELSVV